MKIQKTAAIALLVALGFQKATEWDDEKLAERLAQVHSKVKPEDVAEEHKAIYNQLAKVEDPGKIELVGDKKKKESAPDLDNMDLPSLRAFAEENNIQVRPSEAKTESVLRAVIKKALRGGGKSKVDRAIDKAAAAKTKGKKPAAKTDDDEDEEEGEKKGGREKDKFGFVVGSIRSKVTNALAKDWKTAQEIAEEVGVSLRQARSRLRRAVRKGFAEVDRTIAYRLAPEKKD